MPLKHECIRVLKSWVSLGRQAEMRIEEEWEAFSSLLSHVQTQFLCAEACYAVLMPGTPGLCLKRWGLFRVAGQMFVWEWSYLVVEIQAAEIYLGGLSKGVPRRSDTQRFPRSLFKGAILQHWKPTHPDLQHWARSLVDPAHGLLKLVWACLCTPGKIWL